MDKETQDFCDNEMSLSLRNISELSSLLGSNTELKNSQTGEFVRNEIELNRVHFFYYKSLKNLNTENQSLIRALQLTVTKLLGIVKKLENLYTLNMCKTDKLAELEQRKENYKKQAEFLSSL